MWRLMVLIVALCCGLIWIPQPACADLIALCYHDVTDNGVPDDDMSVSRDNLIAHFAWLREHGYRPVSIDDIFAARSGGQPLPEKAVLLTFDDGYRSFYQRVFPLLKAFNYPAVLALVGSWLETPTGEMVRYGESRVPRELFMSWPQLREVAESGLVEIASHSYDLHRGIIANPQGNELPAMTARAFDPAENSYESDGAYRERLREDFKRNRALLEDKLGLKPRVMVWPYGQYNRIAVDLAEEVGMSLTFSLASEGAGGKDPRVVGRDLVLGNPKAADFVWSLRNRSLHRNFPRRVLHVDLDYVFDEDPVQQEDNLGLLLERVLDLGVNTVYLQAFADPDGDGVADALYFPNRHLPMRADLFNRVAWQLRTRTGVTVYAWMPVLGFALDMPGHLVLARSGDGPDMPAPEAYRRLSPFSGAAARVVGEIYRDLAKHAAFAGLIFHDDAFLSDYEDANPAALEAYRQAGLPESFASIREEVGLLERWTEVKSQRLNGFIAALIEDVRVYRPEIKTARNIFARPVLEPAARHWFAQSLDGFMAQYDYPAIMAMPYMEEAENPDQWLKKLVEAVAAVPGALDQVVFELQSRDWRTGQPVDGSTLARQMELLQSAGVKHYGYYPDDFLNNRPEARLVRPQISSRTIPYRP